MSIIGLWQALCSNRRTDAMDAGQVKALQVERFRKLLQHAFNKSNFYRAYYQDHGITEQDVDELRPEDLPTIDKSIMMENFDSLVTHPNLKRKDLEHFIAGSPAPGTRYLGKFHVIHTSGSSGNIGLFVYAPREWAVNQSLSLRATGIKMPLFRRKRIAFIGATDGHFATVTAFYDLPKYLCKGLPLSVNSPLEEISSQINVFQPDALTGYASGADLLAREQISGRIHIRPSEVFCTGDPLTPAIRERVNEAFGLEPVNVYGSSETMGMACECRSQRNLHLFTDWCSVQVVDDQLQPAKSGRVIVTNLFNYTQPLIRYQMNDALTLSEESCSCGWPYPVIESLAGRQEEFLWFRRQDGSREFIHPIALAEFFVPGLEKFQFIQKSDTDLMMRAVIPSDSLNVEKAVRRRMEEILEQSSLKGDVDFSVEVVDELRNDPKTGKFRLVTPLSV